MLSEKGWVRAHSVRKRLTALEREQHNISSPYSSTDTRSSWSFKAKPLSPHKQAWPGAPFMWSHADTAPSRGWRYFKASWIIHVFPPLLFQLINRCEATVVYPRGTLKGQFSRWLFCIFSIRCFWIVDIYLRTKWEKCNQGRWLWKLFEADSYLVLPVT